MNPGVWAVIAAFVIAETAGDYSTGTKLEKNECQQNLENCTSVHERREMTEEELAAYYQCVIKVTCVRHHRGYLDRLDLLSDIRDRLVAENPESGNWWENSASKLDTTLPTLAVSILTTFILFNAIVN